MKLFLGILFIWFGSSCIDESKPKVKTEVREVPHECRISNDSAMVFRQKFLQSKDPRHLDTALNFLNQAIECDSNYFTAWSNKMSVMNLQNDEEGAMMCMDRLLVLSNYDYMTYFLKGTMFEAYGQVDSANHIYLRVHANLKADLIKVDTLEFDKFHVFIVTEAILYGKTLALASLDSALVVYGKDQRLEMTKALVQDIDKKPYMGGATHKVEFTVPSNEDTIRNDK